MSQHEGRDKKGRKLLPIFLVLVLMVVIASSLFLVLRICGGTNTLNSASFERKRIRLAAATVSLVTLRRDSGKHPDWERIIPIWTLVVAAGFCFWLLVWFNMPSTASSGGFI